VNRFEVGTSGLLSRHFVFDNIRLEPRCSRWSVKSCKTFVKKCVCVPKIARAPPVKALTVGNHGGTQLNGLQP
jgi:hypothetical protein